jgi:putative phage-type endonuclease
MRQLHDLTQGSSEWHAFRANHWGASEAAAMLGLSPYTKRDELLFAKKTGIAKEVNAATQAVFDKGHAVEAMARPIAEKMLGVELYPVTMSFGYLSASCDGLSMDETIAWEHKQYNQAMFEQVSRGELPEQHWPQCQQVLHVTGAEKLWFTVSDGTEENTAGMWVYPDQVKLEKLLTGWKQFEKDLVDYEPPAVVDTVTAEPVMALPSLAIHIKGEVVASNLAAYKEAATAYIDGINETLITDQDFADGDAAVKFCAEAEKTIEAKKAEAIAQTASIDEIMRTLDFIKDQFRTKRLKLEKLVKAQKEQIKLNAIDEAKREALEYLIVAMKEIEPILLPSDFGKFAGAISGLKSIASVKSKLNDCVAQAKIDIDAAARDIRTKQAWVEENYPLYDLLFPDMQALIFKPFEDFKLAVANRVSSHKEMVERQQTETPKKPVEAASVKVQQVIENASAPLPASKIDRPSDEDLIQAVAACFHVGFEQAADWMMAINYKAALEQAKMPF